MSAKQRESEDPKVQNIIDEIEDDIQRERLNELWEKYGNYLIAIAIAIVVGTGAFVTWKGWMQKRNAENTATFIAALDEAQKNETEQAASALTAITQNGPERQAALATIRLAGLKAQQEDVSGAATLYDSVANNAELPTAYRNLSLFLSIQAQATIGDADTLLSRLAPLMDTESPWRGLARELGAVINIRKGDKDAAKALLSENVDDSDASAILRGRDEAILKNMD